jgi:Zn finger protein HypA/HybF involved in hydrogenase expression
MSQVPPRCIENNATQSSESLISLIRKDYGENIEAYAIQCKCGETELIPVAPIGMGLVSFNCPSCGDNQLLFDPKRDGYDGELGNNDNMDMEEPVLFICPQCGGEEFSLACAFQYSGEDDVLEDEEIEKKPQDLFGWFIFAGECVVCGKTTTICDCECA